MEGDVRGKGGDRMVGGEGEEYLVWLLRRETPRQF